jgi:hypothetical protein
MNYDGFRTRWHEALASAGLMPFPALPMETVDLGQMSRTYSIIVSPGDRLKTQPFYVTARLSWEWHAALAARSGTIEEDHLVELLGQDGYYLVTEQPWLRVDVTLGATLLRDAPLPMPEVGAWRLWVNEVGTRITPLLPIESEEEEHGLRMLSSCSEPEAKVRLGSDGQLLLTRLELSAWQGIKLPRQWDSPDRDVDDDPDEQLADLATRVRRALEEWEITLQHLQVPPIS